MDHTRITKVNIQSY